MLTIQQSSTFRQPLPADYGRAEQVKRRASRKATPKAKRELTGYELILSPAGADQAQRRLDEMKRRSLIQPIAEQEWAKLTPFYRAWLVLRGHTPMSYYESEK